MKQRVISAMVGLVILAVVIVFFHTYVFNAVITAISVIAVKELLRATKTDRYRDLMVFAMAFSLLISFANETLLWSRLPLVVFVMLLLFFILLLKNHGRIRFEEASMVFLFSIFVPLCFSSAVYMRNQFGGAGGRYYLLVGLAAAWLCDTGAYFSGMLFGKHKLAPVISPKKTIEGSVGGVIFATVLMIPIALLYIQIAKLLGVSVQVDYPRLLCVMPFLSVIGMLGDLSMSVIKRQFNVKDYGTIMPGHGGILDRFDSALFTLPAVYIVIQFCPLIAIL